MASEFAFPPMIPKLYHKLRPVADGTYAAHLYAVRGTRRTISMIQVVKRCTILIHSVLRVPYREVEGVVTVKAG